MTTEVADEDVLLIRSKVKKKESDTEKNSDEWCFLSHSLKITQTMPSKVSIVEQFSKPED